MKEAVEDYALFNKMSVDELVLQMGNAWGFTAGKLCTGVKILEEMIDDRQCTKFISFTGNLVATGCRGLFRELVKRKLVDVVVTTCGTLDHDLARCWKKYFKGSFVTNDAQLRRNKVNRLGNIFVPDDSYGILIEKKIQGLLTDLWTEGARSVTCSQLCKEIGRRVCNESSILYWAWKNGIPVFVPGITDGAVGYQAWLFSQDHDFRIEILKDSGQLNDIVYTTKKTGALLVGGGISKHHTLWWNQFKNGLDYAVYVSSADEWDGSLSGARPREAVSWGKVSPRAARIMIEGDASLILPVMIASLFNRLEQLA